MARRRRFWFPGAIYHITARGNRRENIFLSDRDRQVYLMILQEVKKACAVQIHAYCLMSNHVHLLIETSNIPPGNILQRLHLKYSKYFNRKYQHVGHLFQNRYHDEIILNHQYFKTACCYIHRNPERANLIGCEDDPLWTSHCYYMDEEEKSFISTNLLTSFLSTSYEEFIKKEKERFPHVPGTLQQ